ncbi:MAG: hypothetical protein AAGJ82_11950 [Bacteroidota bacterium]
MQLHKIKAHFEAFERWLRTPAAEQRLHYWETQAYWQTHWDAERFDLDQVYDACLQNSTTKRIWKRPAYEPKRMMLQFIALDAHFVHSMFQDLFNEEKDAHARVDRFIFYCDQLLLQYRKAKPTAIDTGHYHDDGYEIVSFYLSCQYPNRYAPYQAERFLELLHCVGAANIPSSGDFPRHLKVMRTLQTLLNKEESLLAAHRARLRPEHYQGDSYLLAFDFACFVTGMDAL